MGYASSPTRSSINGRIEILNNYVVATSDSSTNPAASNTGVMQLNNSDGALKAVAAVVRVTKGSGTNPTLNLALQGTNNPTATSPTWVQVLGNLGTAIAGTALDIATASTTTVIQGLDSSAYGRVLFPFQALRVVPTHGGTVNSSEYVVDASVVRG